MSENKEQEQTGKSGRPEGSAVKRLVMSVSDDDFDFYGDWLVGEAIDRFIAGLHRAPYTHICCDGDIIETELIKFQDGSLGVMIGENLGSAGGNF